MACECRSERRFQEKISDDKVAMIKKKRPGESVRNSWNWIFKILFPESSVPKSPCEALCNPKLVIH
jgi:hypothetical protein